MINCAIAGLGRWGRSLVEATDASRLVQALNTKPTALLHRDAGAYRYLTHLLGDEAPRDHLHEAVDLLVAYDARRQANLLGTLERYLECGRAYAPTARELHIHVNTLRQRLQRAKEISGLSLDEEDLLSLQLVIKLVRKGFIPLELPVNYVSRSFAEGKKVSFTRDGLTWLWTILKSRFSPLRRDGANG